MKKETLNFDEAEFIKLFWEFVDEFRTWEKTLRPDTFSRVYMKFLNIQSHQKEFKSFLNDPECPYKEIAGKMRYYGGELGDSPIHYQLYTTNYNIEYDIEYDTKWTNIGE